MTMPNSYIPEGLLQFTKANMVQGVSHFVYGSTISAVVSVWKDCARVVYASTHQKPIVYVHHMEAHAMVTRLPAQNQSIASSRPGSSGSRGLNSHRSGHLSHRSNASGDGTLTRTKLPGQRYD